MKKHSIIKKSHLKRGEKAGHTLFFNHANLFTISRVYKQSTTQYPDLYVSSEVFEKHFFIISFAF